MRLLIILVTLANDFLVQSYQIDDFRCGKKLKSRNRFDEGTVSDATVWPWLASLVNTSNGKLFCSGSIVSEHFVLTAAHCVNDKTKNVYTTQELIVYLGKFNLSASISEDNSEWFHPYQILAHPDWEADETHFDADIAILVAEVPIPFSGTILPICLWTDLQEDEDFVGTVVGWGGSMTG